MLKFFHSLAIVMDSRVEGLLLYSLRYYSPNILAIYNYAESNPNIPGTPICARYHLGFHAVNVWHWLHNIHYNLMKYQHLHVHCS